MPNYNLKNKSSGKEWTEFLSISELDTFLEANPDVEVVIYKRAFISGINNKPDEGFRDILRNIKKRNPGGNVDTFD